MRLASRLIPLFAMAVICWTWAYIPAHSGEVTGRVVGLKRVVEDGKLVQEGIPGVRVQVRDKAGNLIRRADESPLQATTSDGKTQAGKGNFTLEIPDDLIERVDFRVVLTFFKVNRVDVTLPDVNGKANNTISVVQPEIEEDPYARPRYPVCYSPPACYCPPTRRCRLFR